MRLPIYLDNNATTRVDPRALDAMLPYFSDEFGNASSKTHSFGWEADKAVTRARQQLADLLGARSRDIILTSGATEANNMAILGGVDASLRKGKHVITSRIEHPAVLDPCAVLRKRGYEVTELSPHPDGTICADQVRAALRDDTILLSLMAANNEIGTLNAVGDIGRLAQENSVLFHTDAAQAVGKVTLDVEALGIDLLSTSAHKFYGPKGVGALYIRRRTPRLRLSPVLFGGGQESGLRPGTLNVPLVVGMGEAARVAQEDLPEEMPRLRALADRIYSGLRSSVAGVTLNGDSDERLPGTVNLSFERVEANALLLALTDVAVSSGSACSAGSSEPSHVLRGLGIPANRALSSIRFSVGRFNTEDEIEYTIERVGRAIARLRG